MIFAYVMMLVGWGAMAYGFLLAGSSREGKGWLGVTLLLGGFVLTFGGVLLAFAPRFFS